MGATFTFTTSGGYSSVTDYNTSATNLQYTFKLGKVSGKTVRLTLAVSRRSSGTYYYGSDNTTDNRVIFEYNTSSATTKYITYPSSNNQGTYAMNVSTDWIDIVSWDVELTEGNANGNTQRDVPYYFKMLSIYPSGTSGTIRIPAGYISSSQYYTNCSAPTSVTTSPAFVTPTGTITVNWSGASGGINNAINGYTVYYTVSSGGTNPTTSTYTSTVNVTSTATSASTTFTVPTSYQTRGYKIKVGVVTKGGAGSDYYSAIKTGGSTAINQLPAAPTLSKTEQYAAKTASTTVTTTVTAGTDPDGQTTTLYYATSSTGTKSSTTSNFSATVAANSSATYYFWTRDASNEYSSTYSTFTVKQNSTQPAVAFQTPTLTESTSSLLASGSYIPRISNVKFNITKSSYATSIANSGTLTINLLYRTIGSTGSFTTKTVQTADLGNVTSYTANNIDIIAQIGMNKEWYINAVINDGLDSATTRYPASSTAYYYTAPSPTFSALYNQKANSNIGTINSTDFSNYFYTDGRVLLSKDTNFTNATLNFSVNTSPVSTITTSGTIGQATNNSYLDFTNNYNTNYGGKTLTLTSIVLSDGNNTITISPSSVTKTIIYQPVLSNLVGFGTYKPYSQTSGTVSTTVGVGGLTTSNYAQYGISNSSLAEITYEMRNGSYTKVVTTASRSIASNTLTSTINLGDGNLNPGLYPPQNNSASLNFSNIYSAFTYQFVVKVVNVFGYTQELSVSQTIDFRENPVVSGFALKTTNSSGIDINLVVLQESMVVYYTFQPRSYNQGNVNYVLEWSLNNSSWSSIRTGSQTFSANTTAGIVNGTTVTGTWTVPQLSSTGTTYFRVTLQNTNTSLSVTSTSITTTRNKILPATAVITPAKSSTNVQVTVNSNTVSNNTSLTSKTNVAYTHSYANIVYADTNTNPTTSKVSVTTTTFPPTASQLSFALGTANFLNVKLITTHTITQTYTNGSTTYTVSTTQIITSNIASFYGSIATVQYRKNHIGVNNAATFSTTDVVVIGAIDSSRRVIRLIGQGAQSIGTITLPSSTEGVSINTFIIDGGSW